MQKEVHIIYSWKLGKMLYLKKVKALLIYIVEKQKMQGCRQGLTRLGFEQQLIEKYTRAVYSVVRERLYHSTTFRIKESHDDPRNYLVHHYNQSKEFAWSRHEFRVLADEKEGRYECECKLWEHTGTHMKKEK